LRQTLPRSSAQRRRDRGRLSIKAGHADHRLCAGRPERRDGAHPHQEMEEVLKQPLIIETAPAPAAGSPATTVARSAPDG